MADPAGVPEEPVVVYTLRELLERIDERVVRVDQKLNDKASTADVATLATRVDHLESARDRAWGVLLGLSIGSGGIAGAVAAAVARALGG